MTTFFNFFICSKRRGATWGKSLEQLNKWFVRVLLYSWIEEKMCWFFCLNYVRLWRRTEGHTRQVRKFYGLKIIPISGAKLNEFLMFQIICVNLTFMDGVLYTWKPWRQPSIDLFLLVSMVFSVVEIYFHPPFWLCNISMWFLFLVFMIYLITKDFCGNMESNDLLFILRLHFIKLMPCSNGWAFWWPLEWLRALEFF